MIEAKHLFRIHQVFERTVSSLVSGQLTDLPRGSLPVSWISGPDGTDDFPIGFSRRLALSPKQLASTIKRALAARGQYQENEAQSSFNRLIDLYLAKSDFLIVNNPSDPHDGATDVFIKYCKHEAGLPTLTPSLVAGWYPEFLSFTRLDFRPREGQQLTIVPHYRCGAFSKTLGCQVDTRFSLESPVPWLEYDDSISGWRGTVPLFSEFRDGEDDRRIGKVYRAGRTGPYAIVNLLRIEVKAVRTESHGSICVERTLRARLTIKVLPFWSKGFTPSPQSGSIQPKAGQRVTSATLHRTSRAVSSGSRLDKLSEPSIYVSPKTELPSEKLEGPPIDQRSPSQRYWATESQDFEQAVISRVRNSPDQKNSDDSENVRSFDDAKPDTSRAATIQAFERFGLSKPQLVPQTELECYAASIMRPLKLQDGHHSHQKSTDRHSSVESFPGFAPSGSVRRLHDRQSNPSRPQKWQNFLQHFRETMATTRRTFSPKAEQVPASPTPLRDQNVPVAPTLAEGTLHRDITASSEVATEARRTFERENSFLPASAELFALAEALHHQPFVQEQSPRKRSRGVSFEVSPFKKTRENGDTERVLPDTPTRSGIDDGLRNTVASPSDTEDVMVQSPPSFIPFNNRFDILAGLRDDGSDTDLDSDSESSAKSEASSTHDIIVDAYADPEIQKEQALLWKILSEQSSEDADDAKLSAEERKQLFEATKQSWATEERRQSARLGINLSEAFSASDILEQSDSESSSAYQESSSFESSPGSDTIHAGATLEDRIVDPRLTIQKPDDHDSEPESSDFEPSFYPKARIEDHTTESSLSERHESDTDEQTESEQSDNTSFLRLAAMLRSPTPSPAAAPATAGTQDARTSLTKVNLASPSSRPERAAERRLNERGRTRGRMPLMGLFGSASRVRDGSTPRGGGKRCGGFGCGGEDKEN